MENGLGRAKLKERDIGEDGYTDLDMNWSTEEAEIEKKKDGFKEAGLSWICD